MSSLIGIWIFLQGGCVAAGWILSLLGQVNATGYFVVLLLAAGTFAVWRRHWWMGIWKVKLPGWKCLIRRFRRPFPFLFLVTAALAFLGGAIHPPNNYDALSYRLPRTLMWWAHSSWYWIDTPNSRMNFSGPDFEWLTMPLLVWTHSDRFFFLINFAGFLLMPGLLFSILLGAGVKTKVAWAWMWLFPMAFSYFTEAASIGNDTIAGSFILAALYFALRARKGGRLADASLAGLAAGLATGVKASNLPLMLPILVILWPGLRVLRFRLVTGTAMLLLSLAVSFAPMAVLNQIYAGHWAGDPHNSLHQQVKNPVVGLLGNTLLVTAQAVSPHLLPGATEVSDWVGRHLPKSLHDLLMRDFPRFNWRVGELPQEESGGLGLGITILLGAVAFAKRGNGIHAASPPRPRPGLLIGLLSWIALFIYMAKLGNEAASRLLSPYYPLLIIPILLLPAWTDLVKRPWWKFLGIVSGLGTIVAVILTPSRPLWPAGSATAWLARAYPRHSLIARTHRVYVIYQNRHNLLVPLGRHVPDSARVIGLVCGPDDADASLWQPYGARQIQFLDHLDRTKPPVVEWVVAEQWSLEQQVGAPMEKWLSKTGGNVVDQELIVAKVSHKASMWYVLHFK